MTQKLNKLENQIPDEAILRQSQKDIGVSLIRSFGVVRAMKLIDNKYVRYCLYDDERVSLEKLISCNRKILKSMIDETNEEISLAKNIIYEKPKKTLDRKRAI